MKPKINQYSSSISSRYVLGIEGTAPSMQNEICPVVTTVTPRPYYWAFFTWCYYDYYNHKKQLESEIGTEDDYIRRTNYFIALGALLNNKRTVSNFIGADSIDHIVTLSDTVFDYRSSYLQNLSTMGNYRAGIFDGDYSMNLVLEQDPDTMVKYDNKMIAPSGIRLAEAFDSVIRETEYYKAYRLKNTVVPRNVLIELGSIVSIDLSSFPECKELLREYLFERARRTKLRESKDYLDYIFKDTGIKLEGRREGRRILYDYYSPKSSANELPAELHDISSEWEVTIGRQYFVVGLQILWKYMTEVLTEPYTLDAWIQKSIDSQSISFDLSKKNADILAHEVFDFETREQMVSDGRKNKDSCAINNGFRILLSVYNRFHDRKDLSDKARSLLDFGKNDHSVSMNEFFEKVDEYKDQPAELLLIYILKNYVIQQHLNTAFLKMLRHVDGFYIEKTENIYRRVRTFDFSFQALRTENLISVMNDLECF